MAEHESVQTPPARDPYYHRWWAAPPEEERRFRRILWAMLLLALALGSTIPLLPTPEIDRFAAPEIPPRIAKLMVQQQPPPEIREQTPPEPAPEPEPEPEPAPEPEETPPRREETPSPEPVPTQVPQAQDVEAARKKAARSGLLALRSELASLRSGSSEILKKLEQKPRPQKKTGAAPVITAPPSVLDQAVTRTSGGIDTSRLSRETGDTQLAEHEVEQVVSPGDAAPPAAQARPARSNEEIQLVFDQNKGRLNTLYNRALRKNPALAGKVVLRLTIAPSGEVTACEVIASELQDPRLERKLVARVLLFDFGAKDVPEITIDYPLEFFPGG